MATIEIAGGTPVRFYQPNWLTELHRQYRLHRRLRRRLRRLRGDPVRTSRFDWMLELARRS